MIPRPPLSLRTLTAHIKPTDAQLRQRTPRPEHAPLFTRPARELAQMVATQQLSSQELVEAHIGFVRQVNPLLNAVVKDRFDAARREAEQADEAIAQGRPFGPLHGVPCTIKESFQLTGMPNAAGVVARRHLRSEQDAITVKRWREAGAIPLGVTNTPELCMWYETHNYIYGRTNNAYSEAHICGGSSGGEGAIVGAGASPFGLGSDVGGSIRMPAYFNGVFGHKPTGGLVPSSGQYPRSDGDALRYLCTGPLCRSAQDLHMLTDLLTGDDGVDIGIRHDLNLQDPADVDVSGLTFYTIETNEFIHPTDEVRQSVRRAAAALEARGAKVEKVRFGELSKSFDIWSAMLSSAEGPSFRELLHQHDSSRSLLTDFYQWSQRRSPHTLPALVLAMTEKLTSVMTGRVQQAIDAGHNLKAQISDVLGDDGVLLYPTFPTPAPRHFQPLVRPAHFVYTAIFNVLEFPATQIPMGLTQDHLPLGIQAIANHDCDHLGMACAMALEEDIGGWTPPWEALGGLA